MFTCVLMHVHMLMQAHQCTRVCMPAEAKWNLWVSFLRHHPLFLKDGFSQTRSAPQRRTCLTTEHQGSSCLCVSHTGRPQGHNTRPHFLQALISVRPISMATCSILQCVLILHASPQDTSTMQVTYFTICIKIQSPWADCMVIKI